MTKSSTYAKILARRGVLFMTLKEISAFLSSFNTNLYHKNQIGSHKPYIIAIYNYLKKQELSEERIDELIKYIAYFDKKDINLPLYLEILIKSLGYETDYSLEEILEIVKEIHDVYNQNMNLKDIVEYIHATEDEKLRNIFLSNNKYLDRHFTSLKSLTYLDDLRLIAAIYLDDNAYKDFMKYLDNFAENKDCYAPLILFKTYTKLRTHLHDMPKLFWDIYFGNEYLISLYKYNINRHELFKKNIYSQKEKTKNTQPVQLDLFTYQDFAEPTDKQLNLKPFQYCTIYNSISLPDFNEEKDLLLYYKNLLDNKQIIVLPKLKNKKQASYMYETN